MEGGREEVTYGDGCKGEIKVIRDGKEEGGKEGRKGVTYAEIDVEKGRRKGGLYRRMDGWMDVSRKKGRKG